MSASAATNSNSASQIHIIENYFDESSPARPIPLPTIICHSTNPSLSTRANELDSPQIYKNMLEMPKIFIYGGQSVYERFSEKFDLIATLKQVAERLEEEDSEDEALEGLNTQIDTLKKDLNIDIENDLLNFLRIQLGPEREHLIKTILSEFSFIRSTSLGNHLNDYTGAKFNSILCTPVSSMDRTIELSIPSLASGRPVEIASGLTGVYREQLSQNGRLQLNPTIQMVAQGILSIPNAGPTQHDIGIVLSSV